MENKKLLDDLKIRIERMEFMQNDCYPRVCYEKEYATDFRNIEYNNYNNFTQKPLDGTGIILLEQYVKSIFGSTIGAGPSFYGLAPKEGKKDNTELKKDLKEVKRQGDWHYTQGAVRPQLFAAFHNFLLHGFFAMVINPNRERTTARLENLDIENILIENNKIMDMRGSGIYMYMPKAEIKRIMTENKTEIQPGVNTPAMPEDTSDKKGWDWFKEDYPVRVLYVEFPYYNKDNVCKMMCAHYIIDVNYSLKEPFIAQSKDKMESRIIFGTQNESYNNPYGYGAIRENFDTMYKINRMAATVYSTFDKYHEKPLIIDAKTKLSSNSLQFTHKGSVHTLEGVGENTGLAGAIAEKPGINEPFSGYEIIQREWQKMRMRLNAIETLLSNIKTAQSTATMAEISYRDSIEKLEYTTQLLEDALIRPILKKYFHYLMTAEMIDNIAEIRQNDKGEEEEVMLGVDDLEFNVYGTQKRLTQVKELKNIVSGMELVFSTAGALDPDTLKRTIKTDVLIKKVWELSGADSSILRNNDEIEEMLQAENRANADAQAEMMAQQSQAQLPYNDNGAATADNLLPVPSA